MYPSSLIDDLIQSAESLEKLQNYLLAAFIAQTMPTRRVIFVSQATSRKKNIDVRNNFDIQFKQRQTINATL